MTNYLIMPQYTQEHYFFKPYEGICMRAKLPSGIWQEHCPVIEKGRDGFSVYADKNGAVHLICVDDENRLIYAVKKDGIFKKYVLSVLNQDIYVSDMRLYNARGRLNLLYSALYNGETLLIHCILGDHAKPSTVDVLETSHFCVHGEKVYYTNTHGQLGYAALTDEKPAGFTKLCDDAHCCTVYQLGGKEYLLYTRESKLFFGGEELLYDSRMELPVCVRSEGKLYIMWKSGSFVRYITTFNGGATWSEPMRFMNTGAAISLFTAQRGDELFSYYGYSSDKEIMLLGKPDIFDSAAEYKLPSQNELDSLKNMLNVTRREVIDAKKEISQLKDILNKLPNLS